MATEYIENHTFDELHVGDTASLAPRRLTMEDIRLFAALSGSGAPSQVANDYASSSGFQAVVGHGLWSGSLIATLIGTELPGPGTLYQRATFNFHQPVQLGDLLTVNVAVKEKHPEHHQLVLECQGTNQNGEAAVTAEVLVVAPTDKIRRRRALLPEVSLTDRARFYEFLERVSDLPAMRTAVVHPCERTALSGAVEAAKANLIIPVLIGPQAKIRSIAEEAGIDISAYELVHVAHSHEAAERAVELARSGKVDTLMKGSLHTDELLRAVLSKDKGLRTERRLSHVFAFDVPTYDRPLLITDAAINIYPTLEDKVDILQNAIDLFHAFESRDPNVAVLSAVETVTPKIPSTIEAAALCKMADRGQIKGAVVDGPLAFDSAISETAARTKAIASPVAGKADILLVPDLEAGNMLAKQLEYLANAEGAGVLLGARMPIILTSRADDVMTRMASCALAVQLAHYQRTSIP
nr:bifunctional enoyl-CoA hydratase/phosphate acetyltransferase [Gammaproteobacteria bacterium]